MAARGDRRINSTSYEHPQETHLLDLHYAMRYNNAGEPELRVNASGVTIAGNVDVDRVRIWDGTNNLILEQPNNDGDPTTPWTVPTENHNMVFNGTTWDRMRGTIADGVLVQLSNGSIAVTQSTSPWVVTGNANVSVTGNISGITTLPAVTGNVGVSGNVSITQLPGIRGNVTVDNYTGNVRITDMPGITGNVAITDGGGSITVDFDRPVAITDNGGSLTVDGTVTANINGSVPVDFAATSVTAFEELFAVGIFPELQVDAVYGVPTDNMSVRQVGTGTAGDLTHESVFYADSGTTSGSVGQVATKNYMRYRPGQGAMARWTAAFTCSAGTAGVEGARQLSGLFHIGEGYFFGMSGSGTAGETGLGILHSYGGEPEIRTLTINTAPTGAQTATITLNGVDYTVSLVSESAAACAARIANGNSYGGIWRVDYVSNTVTWTSKSAGEKNSTYSFSSTGSGTLATGTFARLNQGVASTNDWTYQSSWNGTAIAGILPDKLNVYAVDFRWLGAGIVRFFMENPTTGHMTLVHTQHWANQHDRPHTYNPSFRLGWTSSVIGTPSQAGRVLGASAMAAIQGPVEQTSYSKSWYAIDSSTRAQNTLHHLLSIHNPFHRNGSENTQELICQDLSVALQNTDPAVVFLFINATPSTNLLYTAIPQTDVVQSTTAATFDSSTNLPVSVFTVGISGNSQFDLLPFNLGLAPGDTLNICVRSSNQITNSSVGIVWRPY